MIPLQRPSIDQSELTRIADVCTSGWLGLGEVTAAFERALSDRFEGRGVVAVNTGTSAVQLGLEAVEHEPGDEVIVPSLTFVATIQAITLAGYRPVFCEVREADLNIDVDDALSRIGARTRIILPVHYAGAVTRDMDRLLEACRRRSIRVVEDAAHAFGSSHCGRPVGTLGDVTCFSFDPIKNITCGEGGAVVSADAELIARVRRMRMLGIDRDAWSHRHAPRPWAYGVTGLGYRHHMPNLNAAIGLGQLEKLDAFRQRKVAVVRRYDEAFSGLPGLTLLDRRVEETFPFAYVVRVAHGRRDEFMRHLQQAGVSSGVHYIPNHLQPLYESPDISLPVTERLFSEIVTLPLFYEITDDQVDRVIQAVRQFFVDGTKASPTWEMVA